jgi:hypothetical protein
MMRTTSNFFIGHRFSRLPPFRRKQNAPYGSAAQA